MTKHEMRQRLAEAMGWTEIRDIPAGGLVGVPPGGGGDLTPIPNPLESDADAAALEVWCVTTRPWCAGLTIIVDRLWVKARVDTYDGDPVAKWVVVYHDTEPDPRHSRRSAVCWAIAYALEYHDAGGEP